MKKEKKASCPNPLACPVAVAVDAIGGKWKGIIFYHLISGPCRFNELRRIMPDITQRVLTLQLRELERDGIINRKIYHEIPPKVEYSLTSFGETLKPIVNLMRDWGDTYEENLQSNRLLYDKKE
ncbi:winged helix-turn-helix transcriptional regulator [Priestia endophytica]|jgi:DNA-binding HxlR family transcriptional regulator|uniref:winged helix-turn-helix transcriptional regulator n=1 Tax=Priestia endophytica TaxID=135735 RepID=UPI001CEF8F22|nr:winged helix-turn-helix transcriptional regulator [Priestia endophytica]